METLNNLSTGCTGLTWASRTSFVALRAGFLRSFSLIFFMSFSVLMGLFGVLLTLGCALPVSLSRLIVLKTPERLIHPFRILKISGAVLPS